MNKTSKTLLVIGVIIVLSYPGVAWVTGIVVQSHLQQTQQQVLERLPNVALLKREYHRGVYRSTEIATYGLRMPAAAAALLSEATITVTSHIQHGPLPGLSTVGLATIDSTVSGPPAMQKALSAALGSTPILRIHTTIGLFRTATVNVTSPAFSTHLPDGSTLAWGGMTGTITAIGNRDRGSANLSVPRFAVQGPQGSFEVTGIEYSGSFEKAFGELYLGDGTLTVERMDGKTATNDFSFDRISVASTSKPDGEFFDMQMDLAMDAAKVTAVRLTKLVYSASFEHFDGQAVASMTQAIRTAQRQAATDPAQLQAGMQSALRQYGADILLHDPVVNLRKVGFTMPEGTFLLSAKVSAPGLTRADLQGPAAVIAAIKEHAQATADLSVDNGLVQRLLAAKGSNPKLGSQLTAFEQQGYLTAGSGAVTTHLVYAAGKLTLNGHPFPPAPPAPPPN